MDPRFLAQAFDHSPVGMAFLQADGTVLSANQALFDMVGKAEWALVGSPLEAHLRPADVPAWSVFFDQFCRDPGASHVFESAFVPVDGLEAWWSIQLSSLTLASGEVTYFAVVQDTTVRRATEQKLREARQLAEGASRAKSEFVANMSHEIRTPLFTITGMTDLLRLGDLKRDQAHHAAQIASAAQHLLDLVNDVLDFSKIEAGQMSLESIPVDLDDVVNRSLEVVSLSAYRKGIELVLDLDPTVPRYWLGDPSRLRQVLVNLLGNAVKFTQKGRVSLVVEPGPTFRVRDTGVGIKESSRASLFQVFTQADSSTTRQFGGTGLGLAISQKLVGLLGGKIEFTSVEGQGTEFFFTLKLPRDENHAAPVLARGQGQSLLVVDDDPAVRDILRRRLGQAGFVVDTAADRAEAHRYLADHRPHVVLIDQELGPEDGWQLASEVRADPATAGLPLVLMSLLRKTFVPSPRYPADLFRCFVDKPVNTRVLIDTLNRGLTGRWEGDDAPAASLLDRALVVRATDRLRILVAEDHEVNRELFRLLLKNLGHHVTLVENGREACEIGPGTRPQLIFMDLQMPEMNGYEASIELRRQGLTCPIVAVTASAVKGELERCQDAGMNGILTKPFNLDTLASVIRSYAPRAKATLVNTLLPPVPVEPTVEPVPEANPGAEVFSLDEALRTFLGNRDLLFKLIERFMVQTGPALENLGALADVGDAAGLRAGAHALKGSAANLTARSLAQAAERLEHAARDGQLEHAVDQVAAIRAAYDTWTAAVRSLPNSGG